jgi:hypothetical protein
MVFAIYIKYDKILLVLNEEESRWK